MTKENIDLNTLDYGEHVAPAKVNKTVVLFNGAPNSGKDVSASLMQKLFGLGVIRAFKDALYEETAKHYGVDLETFKRMATDRKQKEKKSKLLIKYNDTSLFARVVLFIMSLFTSNIFLSPREALIYVSEKIIKPMFGKEFFGEKLVEAIESSGVDVIFVPDSGFHKEITPLVKKGYRVIVVQITRDGCTFAGDSRRMLDKDYLKSLNIPVFDLENNGTLEDLENKLLDIAVQLFK